MAISDYLRLLRFYSHPTYIVIIVAAIYFSGLSVETAKLLVLLYLSFNVFLYGGLYTMNGIADIESDKKHSIKKNRPIASGKISVASALVFAIVLITLGLVTGFMFFDMTVVYLYLTFLVLNLLYTFSLKHIPYVEIFANSVTHPLRFLLAQYIFNNGEILPLLVVGYLLFSIGMACVRRVVERDIKGWQSRNVLMAYTTTSLFLIQLLSFILIIFSFAADSFRYWQLHSLMIIFYVLLVFGIYYSKFIRSISSSLFTR